MLQRNFLKEKLKTGRPVLGTWNTMASPMVTEVLAHAGLDFMMIDFEHGPFHIEAVQEYVTRCERESCSPIVRLPVQQDWMALQALDQGAHGIMMSHIDDKAAAEALVHSVKYPPQGVRGYTPHTKAGGFTNEDAQAYAKKANRLTLSLALIESLDGLNNLDEILSVKGIDVVYFGAYDLSQVLGVPGQMRHPKVLKAITRGVKKTIAAGKCPGGFVAHSQKDVEWLLGLGIKFITYNVDSAILYKPVHNLTTWLKKKYK